MTGYIRHYLNDDVPIISIVYMYRYYKIFNIVLN